MRVTTLLRLNLKDSFLMAKELTARDLVEQIAQLEIGKEYSYVSGNNIAKLARIVPPEGPITFYRYNNKKELTQENISPRMLTKIALVCNAKPNFPIHVDR